MTRVLVIDDNQTILDIVADILRHNNAQVKTILNPDGVEEVLQLFRPHVLLLDVSLPGYDGRNICREIKSNPALGKISIILFSANPMEPESVADAYADDFLEKPFSMDELVEIVQQYSR
ncbi:response regulator [Foetidibacter luteolus]|uniref:response regulator n=1 Tax=Foetidibacter luteolus TaxID=2608880 RepID=UPI00129A2661|nr:response regulator [Foetidibacter luteolus]